jgi:pimeloyl-ACP methyl ester carboxylesterase
MGKTPGREWITHEDHVLDVILDFIDHVIPGRRFVVAGTSYGAYVARGVVYRRSAWMDGLLMTVPVIVRKSAERTRPPDITLVKLADLEPDEARDLEGFAVVQSRKQLERLRTDVFPAIEIADHKFLDRLGHEGFSFDVDNPPEPFDKPTLILMGRQDSNVGYCDAWSILKNYTRGSFVVLDRAGHGLVVEQEGLFQALVKEWLDRVEESFG